METSLLRVNDRIFAPCFLFSLDQFEIHRYNQKTLPEACCKKLFFYFRRNCSETGRRICFSPNINLFPSKSIVQRASSAPSERLNTCCVNVQPIFPMIRRKPQITLHLCFFISIFSLETVDEEKFCSRSPKIDNSWYLV